MTLNTRKEVIEYLLNKVKSKEPILVVGLNNENIPDIHNFYPKKYYESINHCGFGFFEGKTEHGKFNFDAGGAMNNWNSKSSGKYESISWTDLRVDNVEVLRDLGYNFNKVELALKKELGKSGGKCKKYKRSR